MNVLATGRESDSLIDSVLLSTKDAIKVSSESADMEYINPRKRTKWLKTRGTAEFFKQLLKELIILREIQSKSSPNLKIIRKTYPNLLHSSDLFCFLFMNY